MFEGADQNIANVPNSQIPLAQTFCSSCLYYLHVRDMKTYFGPRYGTELKIRIKMAD